MGAPPPSGGAGAGSSEPVRDEAGRVAGIVVAGYDVTTRVRIEQAPRASEADLRELSGG